jgi:hypothetical protein
MDLLWGPHNLLHDGYQGSFSAVKWLGLTLLFNFITDILTKVPKRNERAGKIKFSL